MNTPIADFIDRYIESGTVRFHMPGHKGIGDIEKYDITEIAGADVLYSADGIINESENNATSLFGTAHTFYSTEGSTLAIKAMLSIASTGKNKKILAARNVHKAFIYGCALLDLSVDWLYPDSFTHLCSCIITPTEVHSAISSMEEKPCAVYITSPDYLGNIADIEGIAIVCKNFDIPLLVDNAHGAYLNFLDPSLHPIKLGAAMCADSAHKTLPVLTGGAYLHVSRQYPEFAQAAQSAMSIFASTSPSYLIMRSLDMCNRYLYESFNDDLKKAVEMTDATKEQLRDMGIRLEKSEPLKIVINAHKLGYDGEKMGELLRKYGIEPEFADCEYTVLMTSPKNQEKDFEKLVSVMKAVEKKEPINRAPSELKKSNTVLSIRDAVLSIWESVSVRDAHGRICASPTVSCPPAVPIAVSGERIEKAHIELFEKYGITTVEVVKE